MAKKVQELVVYQKSLSAAHAISAILGRPPLGNDRDLRDQLGSASARVVADIAEGFSQKTDRHFAQFLYNARGSCEEVRAELAIAAGRRYLSEEEVGALSGQFEEVARMLTGLIRYLQREDRKVRG